MAIVLYTNPIDQVFGTLPNELSPEGLVGTSSRGSANTTRRSSPRERAGNEEVVGPRGMTARESRAWFQNRVREHREYLDRWNKMSPEDRAGWNALAQRMYMRERAYMNRTNDGKGWFRDVNTYRTLAGQPVSHTAPGAIWWPDYGDAFITVRPGFSPASIEISMPYALADSLAMLRLTSSRPGAAALFSRNDLRIPTWDTAAAFTTLLNHSFIWTFYPEVIKIRPNEWIGVQIRQLSPEYLPSLPYFDRLVHVSP